MQATTHLVNANLGFEISKRRVLPRFSEVRQRNLTSNRNLRTGSGFTCNRLSSGDVSMGAGLVRARNGIETAVFSSVTSRSVKAQASGGEAEDLTPINPKGKSSGTVLPLSALLVWELYYLVII